MWNAHPPTSFLAAVLTSGVGPAFCRSRTVGPRVSTTVGAADTPWKAQDKTYRLALEVADKHGLEELPCIVRVAHIVERLGRVLASLSEKHLIAARVLVDEISDIVDLAVDGHPAVRGLGVLSERGSGDLGRHGEVVVG